MTLLTFALARGSVAKVLQAVSCISDHLETLYKAASLIVSMANVRLRLLNRNGNLHPQSFTVRSERVCWRELKKWTMREKFACSIIKQRL